ncbi:ankyrin repeat domain-containing protein 61-like [Saccoglossus kowalevskii]
MGLGNSKVSPVKARAQIRTLHKIIREQNVEKCRKFVARNISWDTILPYGPDESDPIYLPHHLMFYHLGNNLNVDILKMLLESGLDPNFGDRMGRTALHYLIRKLHYQKMFIRKEQDADELLETYIDMLCSHGADPNAQDIAGNTALHLGAMYNYRGCISLLRQYGGDMEKTDKHGATPFMKAAEFGSIDVLEELVEHGVNVHHSDYQERTALHAIGRYPRVHRTQCATLLIRNNLDIHKQDINGDTCLHTVARSNSSEDVVVELLRNGADPNVRNNLGRTALFEYLNNHTLWRDMSCRIVVNPRAHRRIFLDLPALVASTNGFCHILDNTSIVRITDYSGLLPQLLHKQTAEELTEHLQILSSSPPSLHHQCRQVIRKAMMKHDRLSTEYVRKLKLPTLLENYLLTPLCLSRILVTSDVDGNDVMPLDLWMNGTNQFLYIQLDNIQ